MLFFNRILKIYPWAFKKICFEINICRNNFTLIQFVCEILNKHPTVSKNTYFGNLNINLMTPYTLQTEIEKH